MKFTLREAWINDVNTAAWSLWKPRGALLLVSIRDWRMRHGRKWYTLQSALLSRLEAFNSWIQDSSYQWIKEKVLLNPISQDLPSCSNRLLSQEQVGLFSHSSPLSIFFLLQVLQGRSIWPLICTNLKHRYLMRITYQHSFSLFNLN